MYIGNPYAIIKEKGLCAMNKRVASVLVLVLILGLAACAPVDVPETQPTTEPPASLQPTTEAIQPAEVTASGKARLVIEGMEWGPVISKVILELDCTVESDSVKKNAFSLRVPGEDYHGIFAAEADGAAMAFNKALSFRTAYTCDQHGAPAGDSNYIALELTYVPDTPAPTLASQTGRGTTFCDYYDLAVQLTEDAALTTTDGAPVTALRILTRLDMAETYFPQLENVSLDGSFTGTDGITLTWGAYTPPEDGETHPLVIWLHGGGEGGTDVRSVIYGNEVTALFGEEFQNTMGGAYVLLPQSPTMWMQRAEDGIGSVYRQTLMELIEDYVNQNPGIDRNRIYVGGCSNGGFMTMDLILHYPDYFAAAYPICGAYGSDNITDDQVTAISHVPMWFIHAENDPVVDKDGFLSVAYRLQSAGAEVHISLFEDVHDTSGRYRDMDGGPYQYIGHWSWIWFFNNECKDGDLNMWQWLAQQSK